jgi:hypothetical protein
MYNFLLILHSIVRWLVVIAALAAAGKAFAGWLGKGTWSHLDDHLGLFFTMAMDIQVLIGLVLYFVSPLIRTALTDLPAAFANPTLLFFSFLHWILILIAVALAHIGRTRSRKANGDPARFRSAAIFYGLSILLVLVAIPWPFTFSRPWIRI